MGRRDTSIANLKKKGAQANPNGRPKAEWTMAGLIKEALEELQEDGTPVKKTIARKLAKLASHGDIVAIKEINNRMDGMSVQKQDVKIEGEVKTLVTIDTKKD